MEGKKLYGLYCLKLYFILTQPPFSNDLHEPVRTYGIEMFNEKKQFVMGKF